MKTKSMVEFNDQGNNIPRVVKEIESSWKKLSSLLLKIENQSHKDIAKLVKINKELEEADKALLNIRSATKIYDRIETKFKIFRQQLEQDTGKMANKFAKELDELLRNPRLSLTGHLPNLRFGIYTIVINLKLDKISILFGQSEERIAQLPFEVKKVSDFIINSKLGSSDEPQDFLKKLEKAYHRILVRDEGKVHICNLLPEMILLMQPNTFLANPQRENFKEYKRTDFSFDLFRVRQWFLSQRSDRLPFDLTVATKAFTQSKKDFLWIPDNENGDGRTYSHLKMN